MATPRWRESSSVHPDSRLVPTVTLVGVAILDVLVVLWWGRSGLRPHDVIGRHGDTYIYLWFLRWWAWSHFHGGG